MDGCKMNGTLPKSDVTRSESLRLETLDRYQIVDAPPDPAIDDLAELAAKVCNAPVAGVSFASEFTLAMGCRSSTCRWAACPRARRSAP
jgi:hypothetical protein